MSLVRAAVALSVVAFTATAAAQRTERPTRILLLFQQQAETGPMLEFSQTFKQTVVRELKSPVEFYQEALDVDRIASPQYSASLSKYLAAKYRQLGIDVVVPVGSRALRLAVGQLHQILPATPVVFALCAEPQVTISQPAYVTGRLASASRFSPTIAMARALQPDADRIIVVGGAGAQDSNAVAAAVNSAAALRDSLHLAVLQGLSLDTLLSQLRRIPRRSIVIFANYRREPSGQAFEPSDIVGSIARASTAPMYTQLGNWVGEGVVGGSVVRNDEEGVHTGRLVARVLRRAVGEPMPPVEPMSTVFVADWRELRRWSLPENRLPPGTEILFRQPTTWERYRALALGTFGVVAVQLLLIGLLLYERRRTRLARLASEEQQRAADEARHQVAHLARVALVGELAATMSHELRQPLAAILVNAEAGVALADRAEDDTDTREIFRSIVADNKRAVQLIEGVRNLLRNGPTVHTTVDLNHLCSDTARLLRHEAAVRRTRLELFLDPSPVTALGDAVELQQVVINLVLNGLDAAATSKAERLVVLYTRVVDGQVELGVRDSGPGISPGVLDNLFKSFVSTKPNGLGLGLPIVRSIVERHHGRVHAENTGAGAVFSVRLPLASGSGDGGRLLDSRAADGAGRL